MIAKPWCVPAGLRDGDIDPSLPIQTISTGVPFTVVPLRGLGNHAQPAGGSAEAREEYLQRSGGKFFYFVSRETVDPAARLHARMMFYNGEDPATGSAAGCAAAWMVAHGVAQARGARADRTGSRDEAPQPDFCPRFPPG